MVNTERTSWGPCNFLFDSGSSVTTIAVSQARDLGLIVPARHAELEVHTAVGIVRQRRHPGQIRVIVPGLPGEQFFWPCHFADQPGRASWPALGLAGVLNDFRIALDGSYSQAAPHGWLVLELLR
jgi:hypothetical protein